MSVFQSNSRALRSDWLTALSASRRFALMFCVGALGALGHPPLALPIFTIASMLILLALAPWTLAPRPAAWVGFAYGLGYFGVTLHWIVEPFLVDIARHGWMAPFGIALTAGGLALFWAAASLVSAWRRSGLAFVLALSLAELARAHLFTGFPWGMHVTAFVETMLYQSAAVLGPHGLTLGAFLVVYGLTRLGMVPALAGVIIVSVGALWPVPDNAAAPPDAPLIRVVQPNATQDIKWREDMIPVFLERKLSATGAAPQADLVLWPEVALPAWLEEAGDLLQSAATRGGGAELLIGAQSLREGRPYNSLAHVSPDGTLAARYDKWHLVPFGEFMPLGSLFARIGVFGLAAFDEIGFSAGPGPVTLEIPGIGTVQPLICYESIFAHEVGRGLARPRLLTIVTNDAWFGELGGPAQHLAQAQARAIEQGLPVARSANTGISAIIDARGRIIAALPLGIAGHVDVRLPDARPTTIYARFGDGPYAILLLLALLAYAVTGRFRLR